MSKNKHSHIHGWEDKLVNTFEKIELYKYTFQFNPLILLIGINPREIIWNSENCFVQRY